MFFLSTVIKTYWACAIMNNSIIIIDEQALFDNKPKLPAIL